MGICVTFHWLNKLDYSVATAMLTLLAVEGGMAADFVGWNPINSLLQNVELWQLLPYWLAPELPPPTGGF